jgi:hypothetical protein
MDEAFVPSPKCRWCTEVQWSRALPAAKKLAFGVMSFLPVSRLSLNTWVISTAFVARGSAVPAWLTVGAFGLPWTKTEQPLIDAVKKKSGSRDFTSGLPERGGIFGVIVRLVMALLHHGRNHSGMHLASCPTAASAEKNLAAYEFFLAFSELNGISSRRAYAIMLARRLIVSLSSSGRSFTDLSYTLGGLPT